MSLNTITLHIKQLMRPQALSRVMAFHGARIFVVGLILAAGAGVAVFFFFSWQLTTGEYDVDAVLKTIHEGRLEKALLELPESQREISLPPPSPF